jgi:carbonic anhydrase/acetyltransferase-like protein (isoleucine patch superfamily)
VSSWALDGVAPGIHPDAWVQPEATVARPQAVLRGHHGEIRVGARTSVQDGTVLHATQEWPTLMTRAGTVRATTEVRTCRSSSP